jgi:hypothetical protein
MAEMTFELISLCPAEPDWRIVFSESSSGSVFTVPVVAWGVFRKRRGSEDLGTSMEGLLADVQPGGPVRSFSCAAATSNFEGYLAPNMPEPPHH